MAELKDALWGLYLDAGSPSLSVLEERMNELDVAAGDLEIPAGPHLDTILEVISGPRLPDRVGSIAVTAALIHRRGASAGRVSGHPEVERVRQLWKRAAGVVPVGRLISDLSPHELEVHTGVTTAGADGLAELPPYIDRAHDLVLREAVTAALSGRSGMVVLHSDSTSGKTRACFQALHWTPGEPGARSLASAGWRLWPAMPLVSAEAVRADLSRVGLRTVVWLNEAQRYLLEPGVEKAAEFATALRELLDSDEGPVLVLGTLWPSYWDTLTARPEPGEPDPRAPVRLLLTTGVHHRVASAFTGPEIRAGGETGHPALVEAAEKAEAGTVTQYLGGAPDLLRRYTTADAAGTALLEAAMDLRRLGHGENLPAALLREAVPAYLTPDLHHQLRRTPDWFLHAVATLTRLGVANTSPLEPLDHHQRPTTAVHYRLADVLDQAGRTTRATTFPDDPFWDAACRHANPTNQVALAHAASRGHRLLTADQLLQHAAGAGDVTALFRLAQARCEAGDAREAERHARNAADTGAYEALVWLATRRAEALDVEGAEQMMRSAADAGDHEALAWLARRRIETGDLDEAELFARRAADAGNVRPLWQVVQARFSAGDVEGAETSARRAPDTGAAIWLIGRLVKAGDVERAERLARAAAETGDVEARIWLIEQRAETGDVTGAERLMRPLADAGHPSALIWMAERLTEVGDMEGAERFARRAAEAGHLGALYQVVEARYETGDVEGAERLETRAAESGDIGLLVKLILRATAAGDADSADRFALRAAEAGYTGALPSLVQERLEAGDVDGAARLARLAADNGHFEAVNGLVQRLTAAGHVNDAERLALHVADTGINAATYHFALVRHKTGHEDGMERLVLLADAGLPAALLDVALHRLDNGDHEEGRRLLVQYLNTLANYPTFPTTNIDDTLTTVFGERGARNDGSPVPAP